MNLFFCFSLWRRWFHPHITRNLGEAELQKAEEGVYLMRPRRGGKSLRGFAIDVRQVLIGKKIRKNCLNGIKKDRSRLWVGKKRTPMRGIEPRPRRWERRILTTRPHGISRAMVVNFSPIGLRTLWSTFQWMFCLADSGRLARKPSPQLQRFWSTLTTDHCWEMKEVCKGCVYNDWRHQCECNFTVNLRWRISEVSFACVLQDATPGNT